MCTCISHALASSHDCSNVLLEAVRHSKAAESITCTGNLPGSNISLIGSCLNGLLLTMQLLFWYTMLLYL
jgi:hypothetical protein